MKKLAITSGYFNPLHPGHIDCFELSKSEAGADELWVIVNNDQQAVAKRGVPSFQDEQYRCRLVASLKSVDRVFLAIDEVDERVSICTSLKDLIQEAKESGEYDTIIFTKWGDRFASEIPEAQILRDAWVAIVDCLGTKTHNSSEYALKRSV
jgi:cytidyltransferase-like protein